jgi:hypothetical protein
MARPFSSDAAGDGIWARVLFEGGETSLSEGFRKCVNRRMNVPIVQFSSVQFS